MGTEIGKSYCVKWKRWTGWNAPPKLVSEANANVQNAKMTLFCPVKSQPQLIPPLPKNMPLHPIDDDDNDDGEDVTTKTRQRMNLRMETTPLLHILIEEGVEDLLRSKILRYDAGPAQGKPPPLQLKILSGTRAKCILISGNDYGFEDCKKLRSLHEFQRFADKFKAKWFRAHCAERELPLFVRKILKLTADKFECQVMRKTAPELLEQNPDLLFHITTMLSPERLVENDADVHSLTSVQVNLSLHFLDRITLDLIMVSLCRSREFSSS
ncbi:hypothetical protein BSLG_002661 [Batrachochytrium salamandrivorans]|nr:hypothetical protein BSLG_002661 [Batrachochytrium salamandrivorans]